MNMSLPVQRGYVAIHSHALFILIISAGILIKSVRTANWAQTSGIIAQNQVIPYYPAAPTPHWSARYGFVSVITKAGGIAEFDYMYVLGGDSYDGEDTRAEHPPGGHEMRFPNGYKNDVWRTTGTEWFQKADNQLRNRYDRKLPRVDSKMRWELVTNGRVPPPDQTYDQWLQCETFFRDLPQSDNSIDCTFTPPTMWSPRRAHAGVYFENYIWVMGGRAREFVPLPEERSIGGVLGPRVQDVPFNENPQIRFSTQREAVVHKNDVWRSKNGFDWELVTAGCRAPQEDIVTAGFEGFGKFGRLTEQCSADSDCYGAEECDTLRGTCMCPMWMAREQHAAAAYKNFMYVVGGLASRLYSQFSNCGEFACGDTDASGYRVFLSDVWRSANGKSWTRITLPAYSSSDSSGGSGYPRFDIPFPGRGGHQLLVLDLSGDTYLYVFGGRGGDNSVNGGPDVYFNDIWRSSLDGNTPDSWQRVASNESVPWSPRTGHAMAYSKPTPSNGQVRTVFLYGGFNNGSFFDDLWSWRIGEDDVDLWRRDFTPDAYFSTGAGEKFQYKKDSPARFYLTPDSPLHMMQRYWVPAEPGKRGKRHERRILLSDETVRIMNSVGLYSIRDLADVDLYTVLKLRGFDFPQVSMEDRLDVADICDYRALAIAVVDKCSLDPVQLFDGEKNLPRNIVPEFKGNPPEEDPIAWHGRAGYDDLQPPVDDVEVLTAQWDGCTYTPAIQGLFGPNVDGLGYVDQVIKVRNPRRELQELFCRWTPQQRAFHQMVVFEERLYLLGGKSSEDVYFQDAWYRDAQLPQASFRITPESRDTYAWFHFVADEPGAYFEYRLWDPVNFKEMREWTPVVSKTNVLWLDWRMGGPSNGRYQLYVRAVDPAGNRDEEYQISRNVYNWYYLSPTPWDIIFGTIAGFLFLCFLAYLEYRRRVKKAAMERYAMKRMRRKFKAMQRDINGRAVDWRTLYTESKQSEEAGIKDRRKKRKQREKNAEKREKERKKREKEKELIKKKLKASKEHKLRTEKTTSVSSKTQKHSQVAPLDGDDMGLEEALELDEEARALRDGTLKEPRKLRDAGRKIAVGGDEAEDPLGMEKAVPVGVGKRSGTKKDMFGRQSARVGTVAIGDSREISAGALPATQNTETGTKKRRVNKRLQEYEAKDGAAGDDRNAAGGSVDSAAVTSRSTAAPAAVVPTSAVATTSSGVKELKKNM